MSLDQKSMSMKRCLKYRKKILDISQQVSALHVAPAFSCLEIVDLIYHRLLRYSKPLNSYKDYFIMSKGHGSLSQYVILEDLNIIQSNDLENYCKKGGILGAHPDRGNPGILASTGSLGHGLGLSVGMSYAERIKNTDALTFVLLSDGELQEGSSWEAAMMAANLNLKSLVVFVDLNDFGGMDRMSVNHPSFYPIEDKFKSFGWETAMVNGHDVSEMEKAIKIRKKEKPFVLLCNTIKGKGVSYMENIPIWHYRSPNNDEYLNAINNLKEIGE
jgi:transketolase